MKKILFLLAICLKVNILLAQTTKKLDANSIVKDNSGQVYPYLMWQKLMETGEYTVKSIKDATGETKEFVIYRMTEEQIVENKKRRQQYIATLPKPRPSEVFKDGEKFRFDKMKDLNGVKYDFKKDTGKVVVYNFWFINCPPCKKEIPQLNDLVEKYKENKDVVFMAIALDDVYSLQNFLKLSPFSYNIVPDGRFFSDKHGVKSYPTHVVVGKDGLVKFSTIGLASNTVYWVEKTIKEQLL